VAPTSSGIVTCTQWPPRWPGVVACKIYQAAPRCLRRNRQELWTIPDGLSLIDEAQISLVDEGGGWSMSTACAIVIDEAQESS
jgi:hypothetical protein